MASISAVRAGGSTDARQTYRPDIDGLRAIAVLLVVAYHAFPKSLTGGFVGVDVFFVISGYLITRILLNDMEADRFSLLKFYERRILRIFPALSLVLLSCLIVGWLTLFPDEFKQLGAHAAAGAGFIANLVLWSETGYFDNSAELKPLLHLWSLGVEEQFYIAWPIALYCLLRFKNSFVKFCAIAWAASFSLSFITTFTDPVGAFFSPFTRFWELLTGGVLAYATVRRNGTVLVSANIQSIVGIAFIAAAALLIKPSSNFPGAWVLLPVLGAFLLIGAGEEAWVNKNILSRRIVIWVGLISYPLYLWHWPILAFLRIGVSDGTFRDVSSGTKVVAIAVAIALSWITYQFIERPIRFGKNRRIWAVALPTIVTGAAACGLFVVVGQGIPQRIKLNPETANVLFEDYRSAQANDNCKEIYPKLKGEWSCLLSKPQKAGVALIGDSHAHQYYESFSRLVPSESVLNWSGPSCLPFSARNGCRKIIDRFVQFIESDDSIHTYILTGYFSYLIAGFKHGNIEGLRVADDVSSKGKERFVAMAARVLSALHSRQKRVVLLIDIPDLVFKPRSCVEFQNGLMKLLRSGADRRVLQECGVEVGQFAERNRDHDQVMRSILSAHPTLETFDPRPLLCNGGICRAFMGGHFIYWNSDHLTIRGADLVVRGFLDSPAGQRIGSSVGSTQREARGQAGGHSHGL